MRRYLERLHVPLFVWSLSPIPRRSRRRAAAWGEIEDISSLSALERAVEKLQQGARPAVDRLARGTPSAAGDRAGGGGGRDDAGQLAVAIAARDLRLRRTGGRLAQRGSTGRLIPRGAIVPAARASSLALLGRLRAPRAKSGTASSQATLPRHPGLVRNRCPRDRWGWRAISGVRLGSAARPD